MTALRSLKCRIFAEYGWNRGELYNLHPGTVQAVSGRFYFIAMKGWITMINVTLKGGVVREYENGTTVLEIAKSLGAGLYKAACAARVNGEECDLRTVLDSDCEVEILTFDDDFGKKAFRHTCSHILAQAVKRLYPNTKLTIGPSIDDGFYYDFDSEISFTPEVLEALEKEMKKIVKENLPLEKFELAPDEAVKMMEEKGET